MALEGDCPGRQHALRDRRASVRRAVWLRPVLAGRCQTDSTQQKGPHVTPTAASADFLSGNSPSIADFLLLMI